MFGYITPLKDELRIREYTTFRSYYCGLCFHLKKEFGNLPRMALNYDMTFLALLLDSLDPAPEEIQMKACFANPVKKKPVILNNKALSYAASMNIALVYYKLLDDVQDNNNPLSRTLALGLSPYKKKFSSSIQKINTLIAKNLNQLTSLEKEKTFASIDEICHPFSLIVANIMCQYPHPLNEDTDILRENLFNFGYALGKWIYMIDALDDLKKDIERKKFNPIHFLYNKENLSYETLLSQVKDDMAFTILNCGYNCKHYLEQLPLIKNKELLENIVSLGMMAQYEKVAHVCSCKKKHK